MRDRAGSTTSLETIAHFAEDALLKAGQTGLWVAFDLATQMGFDPDSPRARELYASMAKDLAYNPRAGL